MKSFLQYVAEDLISKFGTDLSHVAVVFPNKRASLFLSDHLAQLAGKPLWSPAYITISDLFRQLSSRTVADPIKLVCDLHKSFVRQTGTDETLDHFYGWGQLLLADFDDLDKNMADADRVLANLSDLHQLDDVSYLSEAQKAAIRQFFSHFTDDHDTELKQRFLRLWSKMADIYHDFNHLLQQQGLAYEGALYREVAEQAAHSWPSAAGQQPTHYAFVGFNMVQQAEQRLFTILQQQGRALFYWDYDEYYKEGKEAGHFIGQYLSRFPNELKPGLDDVFSHFLKPKQITFVSAPTENIQARYVSQWLRENHRMSHGRRTAIVLCDERLLPTVIHCLPPEAGAVNITTGYPLIQTPAATLAARELSTPATDNIQLLTRLTDTLQHEARQHPDGDPLFQESVFRTYTLANRLLGLCRSGDLSVDATTLSRLATQLIASASVPFHGEPAEGLQVMGVLETRNLDFDHVLLLSCNEGNMPRGVSDTSFIPYSLRKAHGLTTIDHKVAIYAYYFFRLISRASDVTIAYNNSTTDGKTGEMSRFMLQLMAESPHPIRFLTLQAGQHATPFAPPVIDKSSDVMQRLLQRFSTAHNPQRPDAPPLLTPTAVNRYMRCPLLFYYNYACGLTQPDATCDDTIDNRLFGNIFHDAAQTVYEKLTAQSPLVRAAAIESLLRSRVDIERAVDQAFSKNLPATALGPRFNASGLLLINREVIIHYVRQLLHTDSRLAPFTIIGTECLIAATLATPHITTTIGGRIDRLDRVTEADGERLRVIDYKTGSSRLRPLASLDAVFSQESLSSHSDYYLQALLYSSLVSPSAAYNPDRLPVSPALLFIQHASQESYDPVLSFGQQRIGDVAPFSSEFTAQLSRVVDDIFNPDLPFTPTADDTRCTTCPYRQLCRS